MRSLKAWTTALLFVFTLCFVLSDVARGNVLGDMQTFAPNTDGLDFITVHTGRPLKQGWWAFSNYVNYARGHLLVYSDMVSQEKINPYNDQLAEYDLDIAYAWSDHLQLFFATPILMWQEPDQDKPIKVNISKGSATYRPGMKYTFSKGRSQHAFIGSLEQLAVENSPYVGVRPGPIVNLEWAGTWSDGEHSHGFNAGYRVRSPTEMPTDARMFPIDDQLLLSYGYSAPFTRTSRWVFEIFTSMPTQQDPYKNVMDASSVDLLLALKHRWVKNLNFDWGGTIEPGVASLAPQFRVFAGLVYYWKPESRSTPNEVIEPTPRPADLREEDVYTSGDGFMPGEADEENARPSDLLTVDPERSEVFEGKTVQLRARGGIPPYKYEVIDGPGRVSPTGLVRTSRPGKIVVAVRDQSGGGEARAVIFVKMIPKPDREFVLKNLEFDFDSDRLTAKSMDMLDRQVPTLKGLNVQRLIIVGHTDSLGNDDYNADLSERRANAIKRILAPALGLRDDQVTAVGRGESMPIATNKTAAGRQANRRVELKVYFK